jgi:hypothetical protein
MISPTIKMWHGVISVCDFSSSPVPKLFGTQSLVEIQ